jgi:threonine dehydrogenase-like Zn-dependent dehydrogenase
MDKMMKAAAKTATGEFKIKDVPIPEITDPNFVLARVRATGICGSDMAYWKVPVPKENFWSGEGAIMGHELAGDVVEVGSAVTNVKPGDRVGIDSVVSCGKCYWCRVGQYHLCPESGRIRSKTLARGFSQYVAGPSEKFYPIPKHVGYGEAAIMDVYGTSVHAINRLGIRMDQNVVIIGSGPIGLSLLDLVNVAGAKGIVTDILDGPLDVAKKTFGAYATVNTAKEDLAKKVLELTDGLGADVAVECVGGRAMETTMSQAVSVVHKKGKVGMVGMLREKQPLVFDYASGSKLHMGEVDLIGVSGFYFWGNDPEFKIVTDLLSQGKLHATEMITHRFPLEKINEAFETVAAKDKTKSLKVIVEP